MTPAAIGGTAIAGTVAGSLLQGFGTNQADQAKAAASRYQAGVAQLNQQINQQNASWATQSGGIQAQTQGLKTAQEVSGTEVNQSGSGFDVNSGSALRTRQSQTTVGQFNQATTQWNASKVAYGYETQATMDQAQSQLDEMAASSESTAGDLSIATSFINAGTGVASKWMQGKQAGIYS